MEALGYSPNPTLKPALDETCIGVEWAVHRYFKCEDAVRQTLSPLFRFALSLPYFFLSSRLFSCFPAYSSPSSIPSFLASSSLASSLTSSHSFLPLLVSS